MVNNKKQISEFLSRFFAGLNGDGISYCVLKNYNSLPEKVGNDVDIWIKDGEQERFQSRLLETAEHFGWDLIKYSPRLSYKGEGDYFFAKNHQGLQIIHIDCWSFLYWRGMSYLDDGVFSKNLLLHKKGFCIPSPGLECSILLLKDLIYQKKILEKYRERIFHLFNKEPGGFFECVETSFTESAAKFILDGVKDKKWDELEGKTNFLRWSLFKKLLFKKHFFYLKDSILYFLGRLKKYLFPKTGIFLVLLGPDGSGKSTIAEHVMKSEIIRKLFINRRYFHSRFDFLPPLRKYLSFFTKSKPDHAPKPQQTKTYGMFRAMAYPIYYGMSYFLGHPLLWKEKACAGLVIFDRYYYDFLIQRELVKCPKWLIFSVAKFIPKPDIIIYLRDLPETIYERKQELSIDEIKKQFEIYEKTMAYFPGGISVETSTTIQKVVEQIEWIIIEKIREKQKL